MSRIYFHTPTETVEVYGSERAYIGLLCAKMATGVFDMLPWERKRDLLPDGWQESNPKQHGITLRMDRTFSLLLGSSFEDRFSYGQQIFDCVLNTVLRTGSPAMQLAARIHAQCEIHGYVEPEDGEFIASMIEEGLEIGIFREHRPLDEVPTEDLNGWREVCRVLRAGEIVVTSYSICDGFPNAAVAVDGGTWDLPKVGDRDPADRVEGDDPEEGDWDLWYGLSRSEQWELAVRALRTDTRGLRWAKEGWSQFYFGSGRQALDYVNRKAFS